MFKLLSSLIFFFFHEQDENIGFHQYIIVRFYEYINNTNQRNFEKKN